MLGSAVAMAVNPINQSGKFSTGYFSIRKLYRISAHTSAGARMHTLYLRVSMYRRSKRRLLSLAVLNTGLHNEEGINSLRRKSKFNL
jgi:hypothetical protein